jgi:hypothetical protein
MMVPSENLLGSFGLMFRNLDDISVVDVVFFRPVALVLMMCEVI